MGLDARLPINSKDVRLDMEKNGQRRTMENVFVIMKNMFQISEDEKVKAD